MRNARLIARLDVKGPNLIKGIHLEGLRIIGDPQEYATRYYQQGADELLYIDIVASLYGRNSLHEIVSRAARDIFVPLTVGGGIRSIDDVRTMLRAGADKCAINTAAIRRPELIGEIAQVFGSQCMVLGVEAKRLGPGKWECFTDNGREFTGVDAVEWCRKGYESGAGEILLTSVDQEGTRKGFDIPLIEAVSKVVPIPIIASGGMGTITHMVEAYNHGADAIAVADMLHYNRSTLPEIRAAATASEMGVRQDVEMTVP
jgi:cyclase